MGTAMGTDTGMRRIEPMPDNRLRSSAENSASTSSRMLLAHEWIAPTGGSENVFRELMESFPDADAVCLWNDVPSTFERPVRESSLAAGPLRGRKALALPFMPRAWREFDLGQYDTVLASSHAFAHHLAGRAAREGRRAYAYVHTPARYIWAPDVEHRGRRWSARVGSVPLKRLDRGVIDNRVKYAANSQYVRDRVRRSWHVDSDVIYPPVQVERIQSVPRWRDVLSAEEMPLFEMLPKDGFVLGASRLVSYKRLDLAMEVGQALALPVVIAGSGPDQAKLKERAASVSVPVIFTGRVSDEQLYALYQEASLFVFLAIEDFGIMPVECIAAGTPVLVNTDGGAQESVVRSGGGAMVSAEADGRTLGAAAEGAMRAPILDAANAVQAFSVSSFRYAVARWAGVSHE